MANICLTLYRNWFFASIPKSPTQMGSLSVYNSVTNISCLGTFKYCCWGPTNMKSFFVCLEVQLRRRYLNAENHKNRGCEGWRRQVKKWQLLPIYVPSKQGDPRLEGWPSTASFLPSEAGGERSGRVWFVLWWTVHTVCPYGPFIAYPGRSCSVASFLLLEIPAAAIYRSLQPTVITEYTYGGSLLQ
jgi:hypothetical protein